MKAQDVLEHLYRSEINARLQWQWDGGFDVALLAGYSNDEVLWEGNYDDLDTAATFLGDQAAARYPSSGFALWWQATMGFPVGWTASDASATPSSRKSRSSLEKQSLRPKDANLPKVRRRKT